MNGVFMKEKLNIFQSLFPFFSTDASIDQMRKNSYLSKLVTSFFKNMKALPITLKSF